MQKSSDDIVDAVIDVLRLRNRELSSVTLEEAKQLTLELLRQQRSSNQTLEVAGPLS